MRSSLGRGPVAFVVAAGLSLLTCASAQTLESAPVIAHAEGRVVDERGRPIPDAAVHAIARHDFCDVSAALANARARTNADGRYRIPLVEADREGWLLHATAGRQAYARRLPWVEEGDVVTGADAVLVPGSELLGRLRSADGSAVTGAKVSVWSAVQGKRWNGDRHVSGAVSDARGFFRVPCVAPSALELYVTHDRHLAHAQIASVLAPLDITLDPAVVVPVEVVDAEGAPVADVPVDVDTVFGDDHRERSPRTDEHGRVGVRVPPGRPFAIAARRFPAFAQSGPHLPHVEAVTLTLQAGETGEFPVRVVVRDGTGAPIRGARVRPSTIPVDATLDAYAAVLAGRLRPLPLGEDGTVRVSRGTQSLWIDADGFGSKRVACDRNEEPIEVRLGPECVITGVVHDGDSGDPVADVAVRALPWFENGGGTGQTTDGPPRTNAQGRFEIRGLAAGSYALQVHVRGRRASLPVRVEAAPDRPAEVELQLPELVSIEVDIAGETRVDMDDRPLPWLHHSQISSSVRAGYNHRNPPSAPVAVDAPGRFELAPMLTSDDFVVVRVPSRHRAAVAAARHVFGQENRRGPVDIDALLPISVGGAVTADEALPFERLALLAVPLQLEHDPRFPRARPRPMEDVLTFASLDERGAFAIDLLPGRYELHLVDLLTDIVFWSSSEPYEPSIEELQLEPDIRWLTLRCRTGDGSDLVVPPLVVECADEDRKSCRGRLHPAPMITFPRGATEQQWLVPAGGTVSIAVQDTFAALRGERPDGPLLSSSIEITAPRQELVLELPAAPGGDSEATSAKGADR